MLRVTEFYEKAEDSRMNGQAFKEFMLKVKEYAKQLDSAGVDDVDFTYQQSITSGDTVIYTGVVKYRSDNEIPCNFAAETVAATPNGVPGFPSWKFRALPASGAIG